MPSAVPSGSLVLHCVRVELLDVCESLQEYSIGGDADDGKRRLFAPTVPPSSPLAPAQIKQTHTCNFVSGKARAVPTELSLAQAVTSCDMRDGAGCGATKEDHGLVGPLSFSCPQREVRGCDWVWATQREAASELPRYSAMVPELQAAGDDGKT